MTARIGEVAALARVSVGTVSNVLNHSVPVSDELRARVLEAVAILGYVPNDLARQLRTGTSSAIGMIVLDVANPFFMQVFRGAEQAAAGLESMVILGNSDHDHKRERDYLRLFERQHVRGFIVAPVNSAPVIESASPFVVLGSPGPGAAASSVGTDDFAGGRLVTSHLLEGGRHRLAFIGSIGLAEVARRLDGMRAAITQGGVGATLEVLPAPGRSMADGVRLAGALLDRAPDERPDAIFCANDLIAIGLMRAWEGRVRMPEDVAIVGYDDIEVARDQRVPLTSVRQPALEIGRMAVRLLGEMASARYAEPRLVTFEPQLVVRQSSDLRVRERIGA